MHFNTWPYRNSNLWATKEEFFNKKEASVGTAGLPNRLVCEIAFL